MPGSRVLARSLSKQSVEAVEQLRQKGTAAANIGKIEFYHQSLSAGKESFLRGRISRLGTSDANHPPLDIWAAWWHRRIEASGSTQLRIDQHYAPQRSNGFFLE